MSRWSEKPRSRAVGGIVRALVLVVVFGQGALACNALLGNETRELDELPRTPVPEASTGDAGGGVDAQPDACITADLSRDDQNCGTCGHDCLGAGCVAGQCQIGVLTDAVIDNKVLLSDGEHLYFTNRRGVDLDAGGGSLNRVAIRGGTVETLATLQPRANGIAFDGDYVYWINQGNVPASDGSVWRVRKDRTAPPARLISGLGNPPYVGLDALNLYWVEINGALGRANKDGSSPLRLNTKDGGPAYSDLNPSSLVVDKQGVLFANQGTIPSGFVDGTVSTLIAPTRIVNIASSLQRPQGLAADSTAMFWFSVQDDAGVFAMSRDGDGGPRRIAHGVADFTILVVDGGWLYWTSPGTAPAYDDGSVMKIATTANCPSQFSCAVVVAANQKLPQGLAVDDKGVYWARFTAGFTKQEIVRLAK